MDYDPAIISYANILAIFWQSHEPTARAWSAQYKVALFVHDDEQRAQAEASKARLAEEKKGRFLSRGIHTEVLPAQIFYIAEDYHQKYLLRRAKQIWEELTTIYPTIDGWLNSTAAARLNGYVGGYGKKERLEEEIDLLGLSVAAQEKLRNIVRGRW